MNPFSSRSSSTLSFAAANTSNGAPFSICSDRVPVEPKENATVQLLAFSNSDPTSVKAFVKSEAAATISSAFFL